MEYGLSTPGLMTDWGLQTCPTTPHTSCGPTVEGWGHGLTDLGPEPKACMREGIP